MSNANQPRELSGTPNGGQWAAATKDGAAGVTLTDEPAAEPQRTLGERISGQLADVDRRFKELEEERTALATASLAAYVAEFQPGARALRWEVQIEPAYHTGEQEYRRLVLDELLDADGERIEAEGDHYEWIDDALEDYATTVGVPAGPEGTTGHIDLDAALAAHR